MKEISVTLKTIYLAVVLLIMGEGLKNLNYIKKKVIIFLLLAISIVINFIFYGMNVYTFIEAILATSISTFMYDVIKSIKKYKK